MSDTQLAILLRQYHARLVDAIAETFAVLPVEAKQTRTQTFLNPFVTGGTESRVIVEAPALETLEAFADSLKSDIALLERATNAALPRTASTPSE